MVSEDFIDVLLLAQQVLPSREYNQLIAELDRPVNISLRVNRLKAEPDLAIRDWSKWYGWSFEQVSFCPSGYWIRETHCPPSATITHRMGYYYIQEAASMLPAELFDFSLLPKHALILDMAASPGGKTTHLADRLGDRGLVVANDASRARLPALEAVLRNWGMINQAITCLPGEFFGGTYVSNFDAVLLDAPCSMQGLRGTESHAIRPISVNEIKSLVARQVRLLESALRAVRPGGQVVYSTCTLTVQENEGVIEEILARYPREVELIDAHARVHGAAFGLDEYAGKRFPLAISKTARLWPHNLGTAGFFCALLTKKDEFPPFREAIDRRLVPPQPRYRCLNRAQTAEWINYINDKYGFSLIPVMEKQNLHLYEINNQVFLMPVLLREKMEYLPWISSGMLLGKRITGELQPSHEFISRFGDQFQKWLLVLEDQFIEAWLNGEDLRGFTITFAEQGAIVVVRDKLGRNLGRGKVLGNRLKNMLPTRLF